jgi:rubrerythrin
MVKDEVNKVLTALKTGIELESYGLKFYTKAASEVKDPKGRQTLQFLANEEKDHLKFFKDLRESFLKGGQDSTKNIIQLHYGSNRSKVFPEMEEYLEEIKDSRGDEKILEEAEGIEKRSISFYKSSAGEVLNPDYQEIFKVLIREEEGHLKLIWQMSDYMKLHGVWSGLEEYFVNE